ncbi:hypothetical protein ACFFRR_004355 [Megaselia abdita]
MVEVRYKSKPKDAMSDVNIFYKPASSISHLMLAGTSGWALKNLPADFPIVFTSFTLLFGHGILGIIKFTSVEQSNFIRSLYSQTTLLVECLPIPLLNAELFLTAGYNEGFVWSHVFSSMVPFVSQCFLEESTNSIISDLVLVGNLASMMYFCVMHDPGTWTGGLVMMAALNKFVFEKVAGRYDVPRSDFSSVGLAFYTMFALGALNDTK